jgi:hypothetical protein
VRARAGPRRLGGERGGTGIVWRGDSHYGRVEAMEWAENNDAVYIFGLAGNAALDALVAETAVNLRFHHAMSSQAKLRTYASFMYQAGSWLVPPTCHLSPVTCHLLPVSCYLSAVACYPRKLNQINCHLSHFGKRGSAPRLSLGRRA